MELIGFSTARLWRDPIPVIWDLILLRQIKTIIFWDCEGLAGPGMHPLFAPRGVKWKGMGGCLSSWMATICKTFIFVFLTLVL